MDTYYVVKTKNGKFIALDSASTGYPYETTLLNAHKFPKDQAHKEANDSYTKELYGPCKVYRVALVLEAE
jgi:hypothetical protein